MQESETIMRRRRRDALCWRRLRARNSLMRLSVSLRLSSLVRSTCGYGAYVKPLSLLLSIKEECNRRAEG